MGEQPVWMPSPERLRSALLISFMDEVRKRWGVHHANYAAFHHWSIAEPEAFWRSVWDFCRVRGFSGVQVLEHGERMPGVCFFPEARLNFAENLLRGVSHTVTWPDTEDALIYWGEQRVRRRLSRRDHYIEVARLAAALRASGVVEGDRVAAYLTNLPETILAMLAAASIGAVFSSCSPDFGVQAAADRYGQTKPKVLFASDGYYYNNKTLDSLGKLVGVVDQLPSLEHVIVVPYVQEFPAVTHIRSS